MICRAIKYFYQFLFMYHVLYQIQIVFILYFARIDRRLYSWNHIPPSYTDVEEKLLRMQDLKKKKKMEILQVAK